MKHELTLSGSVSHPRPALGLGLLIAAILALPARAASDLDKEMAELAKQVEGVVKDRGNVIQVGDFVAKGNAARQAATGGTAIAKALLDQLTKRGVNVSRTAELLVSGEFRDVTDKDSKTTALQIKAKIEDRRGEPVVELDSRGLFSLTTIAALVGLTTVTPPAASHEQAEKRLDQALDKIQSPRLAGTRITPVQDGATLPYSIEILVGPDPGQAKPDLKNYAPRAATLDQDGLAFLTIRRGEVYAVKVNNDSKFDAAVTLTIDGLSMYSFSDNKNYEVVFVHAGKSGDHSRLAPDQRRLRQLSGRRVRQERRRQAASQLVDLRHDHRQLQGGLAQGRSTAGRRARPQAEHAIRRRDRAGQPDRREIRRGNAQHRPVPRRGQRALQQDHRPGRLAQAESLM